MKKNVVTYVISGIIYLIALFSISPLLGNEDQVEWFGAGIYHFLLIICWTSFFLIFLLVGLVFNRSGLRNPRKKILRIFKISILGAIVIVGYGSIKYNIDFNNWQEKSKAERAEYEKEEELKFHSTVDSLQIIVASDSPNPDVFFELGLMYRHNGEWERSVENYRKAIEIDSNKSKYHSELAYSQSFLGSYDEAIKHYEVAYSLDSTRKWIKSDIERCKKMKEMRGIDTYN